MPYEVNIELKADHVYVRAVGKYDHEKSKKALYEVLDTCYKNDTRSILVDYRDQTGKINLIQRLDYFLFITNVIKDLFPKQRETIKVVYLGNLAKDQDSGKVKKVIERSGVNIGITDDESQAITWLLGREKI